ncbi:MAG: ChaN family lipoprotein [Paracoccaceae bacterium]
MPQRAPIAARIARAGVFASVAAAIAAVLSGGGTARAEGMAHPLDHWPEAEVFVLGEVHDNPQHHLNQARAIRAIAPRVVVWEMIAPGTAMPERRDDPEVVASALGWQGWPDFAMYFPILQASGDAVHVGANVPRPDARRAFTEGAAAVLGAGAARFGLDLPLPADEQAIREAEQFTEHCEAMPREMMTGMVEAQRLRDAALARAALEAVHDTGGPVVVITGNGHARTDWGVPALLRRAEPGLRVVALGQFEGEPEGEIPWDRWIVTPPVERGDPCLAFR